MKPGAMVGIRGPFGRGFPYERFRGKDMLFVAGGLGLSTPAFLDQRSVG
jgi:sulfhydrogenase subunit gamma (sulfur reductase)